MTPFDSTRALNEGWAIFDIDSTGVLQIQRLDDFPEPHPFRSDDEAFGFVLTNALEGSDYHRDALARTGIRFDEGPDAEVQRPRFPQVFRIPKLPCNRCGKTIPSSGKEAVIVCRPPRPGDGGEHYGHYYCSYDCGKLGPKPPLLLMDIDGFMIKYPSKDTPMHHELSPEAVAALKKVHEAHPDLQVVVTSDRRRTDSFPVLWQPWKDAGLPEHFLFMVTPTLESVDLASRRSAEIKMFLSLAAKYWRWVVGDDQTVGMVGVIPPERLVITDPAVGFDDAAADRMIAILHDDRDHPWPMPPSDDEL